MKMMMMKMMKITTAMMLTIAFERVAPNPSRHRTHPLRQGNGMNITLTYEAHFVKLLEAAVRLGNERNIT